MIEWPPKDSQGNDLWPAEPCAICGQGYISHYGLERFCPMYATYRRQHAVDLPIPVAIQGSQLGQVSTHALKMEIRRRAAGKRRRPNAD